MPDLGENLRTAIVASTGILAQFAGAAKPHAVEQDAFSENPPDPRIWYRMASETEDLDLDGTHGLIESHWDIEVVATDNEQRHDIATAVKAFLNGKRGTLGSGSVLGIFVEDHNDEYIPKSVSSEDGYCVAAISATIFSTA